MDPIIAAGAPLVLALVQAFRPITDDRWLPLVSLFCGGCGAVLFAIAGQIPWQEAPLSGIMIGLAASGLYSGSRTTLGVKQ
jgi:hypothetical protein